MNRKNISDGHTGGYLTAIKISDQWFLLMLNQNFL